MECVRLCGQALGQYERQPAIVQAVLDLVLEEIDQNAPGSGVETGVVRQAMLAMLRLQPPLPEPLQTYAKWFAGVLLSMEQNKQLLTSFSARKTIREPGGTPATYLIDLYYRLDTSRRCRHNDAVREVLWINIEGPRAVQ